MISALFPYKGELFSCWLYRQSLFSKHTPLKLYRLEEIYWECANEASFDPDFDFASDFVRRACSVLRISEPEYQYFFSANTWIVPRAFRKCFCYGCFCDQIKNVGHPTCKVSWATVYVTACPDHECVLLESRLNSTKNLDLGITQFKSYYTNGVRDVLESGSSGEVPELLMPILLKIQSHLEEAEIMSQASVDEKVIAYWEFCKTMLRIFLFPAFGLVNIAGRFGSFASFKGQVSFLRLFFNGPLIANLQHRRIATMFLGLLLGLVKGEDHSVFIEFLQRNCTWRLGNFDPYEMGRLANVFSSNNSAFVNQILRCQGSYVSRPETDLFMSGFLIRAEVE